MQLPADVGRYLGEHLTRDLNAAFVAVSPQGMVLEVGGAFGKEQVVVSVALKEGNQNRRRAQRAQRDSLAREDLQLSGQAVAIEHQTAVLSALSRKAVMVAA